MQSRSKPSFEELDDIFRKAIGEDHVRAFRDNLVLPASLPDFADAPPKILIILFASRSGSTYAGQLLANTPYFKHVGETFNPPELEKLRNKHGLAEHSAAAKRAVSTIGTSHAFGAKCGIPGIVGAMYSGFLPALIDRVQFVSLTRRDTVAQAVSMAKAHLSGQYHSTGKAQRDVHEDDYDWRHIARCRDQIEAANGRLERLSTALPNPSLPVFYEDVMADPGGFVNQVLDFIDLPRIDTPATDTRLSVLRNSLNHRWKERFIAETEAREQHYLKASYVPAPLKTGAFGLSPRMRNTIKRMAGRKPKTREDFLGLLGSYRGEKKTRGICASIEVKTIGGFSNPPKILCLLATQRSGARAVAAALGRTQHFATVAEPFSAGVLTAMRDARKLGDCREAAQRMVDVHGTAHAFGFHGGLDMLVGAAHVGFLHEAIGRMTFVRVQRRDPIRHAAALFFQQLNRSADKPPTAADYDRDAIARIMETAAHQNAQLDRIVSDFGAEAHHLLFEPSEDDPMHIAQSICVHMALETAPPEADGPVTQEDDQEKHLSDNAEIIENWARRFASESNG